MDLISTFQGSLMEGFLPAGWDLKKIDRLAAEAAAELVKRMLDAEVPVMGHIGLTPQSVHTMGGFKVQGKSLPAVTSLPLAR